MAVSLYHQCGHNFNWNKESFLQDHCGTGLILSPVHMKKNQIEALPHEIRVKSFFDPQYFLPSSQKKKLSSYDFFPEVISNGFISSDFSLVALESAKKCVAFQIEQDFNRVIIPARYYSEMITDYTEKQDLYTVHPFLKAIEECECDKPVFLTVPLTHGMITDSSYRTQILNWITNYPRIDGVYLLFQDDRTTKQCQDFEFIKCQLQTVKDLVTAGLEVTISHMNSEGLLFLLIEGCEITFGAYENTRLFSIDKFIVSDDERRGPRSRLYLPGLFNWLHFHQAKLIKQQLPNTWEDIYLPTIYGNDALAAATEPHFNFPALYKHFFIAYQKQIDTLTPLSPEDRYLQLRDWFRKAIVHYEGINDHPIDLDRHGKGDHIQPWLDVVNWFFTEYLK